MLEITKIYPLDAIFDNPEEVPEDVREDCVAAQWYPTKMVNEDNMMLFCAGKSQ